MVQQEFQIDTSPKSIRCIRYGESTPEAQENLIFTHGAGGNLESEGTANFTAGFSQVAPILCFQGSLNFNSRVKMFSTVIDDQNFSTNLGGRSMGARAAVVASRDATRHLVLVSYPLQTSKQTRDQILVDLPDTIKVLFISGDKDSMCDLNELRRVRHRMKCPSWLVTVTGADHGMKMRPNAATESVGRKTGEIAAEWLSEEKSEPGEGEISWDADEGEVKWSGWTENVIKAEASKHKSPRKTSKKAQKDQQKQNPAETEVKDSGSTRTRKRKRV